MNIKKYSKIITTFLVMMILLSICNTCFADVVMPGEHYHGSHGIHFIEKKDEVSEDINFWQVILIGIVIILIISICIIIIKKIIKNKKENKNHNNETEHENEKK